MSRLRTRHLRMEWEAGEQAALDDHKVGALLVPTTDEGYAARHEDCSWCLGYESQALALIREQSHTPTRWDMCTCGCTRTEHHLSGCTNCANCSAFDEGYESITPAPEPLDKKIYYVTERRTPGQVGWHRAGWFDKLTTPTDAEFQRTEVQAQYSGDEVRIRRITEETVLTGKAAWAAHETQIARKAAREAGPYTGDDDTNPAR